MLLHGVSGWNPVPKSLETRNEKQRKAVAAGLGTRLLILVP